VALAHYADARDPRSFNAKTFANPDIRSLASRVTISVSDEAKKGGTLASTVTVTLKDGRAATHRVADFKGTPESPLSPDEMRDKFMMITSHCDPKAMGRLFDRIQNIEREKTLDWLKVPAATKRKPAKKKKR
jgi:2-methylcitrate dehydratase PrpD